MKLDPPVYVNSGRAHGGDYAAGLAPALWIIQMTSLHQVPCTGEALTVILTTAAFAWCSLRLPRRKRAMALSILAIPIFLAPLLVPLPSTEWRLAVALASINVGVKLYDLHFAVETGPRPWLLAFLAYLPNPCNLEFRRIAAHRPPSRRKEVMRLGWLIPATAACAVAVVIIWHVDWRPRPWIVEHCFKVIAVCGCIQFGSNIITVAWRLMGVAAMDFSGSFFAAATPAEFWRRWNQPAGRFFHDYLFVPLGGWKRRWFAVVTAFGINGLVHEYVFGIAAGRVLRFAMLFFLVQGLATATSMSLRPKGSARFGGIALTLVFNLASSVWLFRCVQAVAPFYVTR